MNAAFLASVEGDGKKFAKSTLVFGGMSVFFNRATSIEAYLVGKEINSNQTLRGKVATF